MHFDAIYLTHNGDPGAAGAERRQVSRGGLPVVDCIRERGSGLMREAGIESKTIFRTDQMRRWQTRATEGREGLTPASEEEAASNAHPPARE